jgi:hypothetical protein
VIGQLPPLRATLRIALVAAALLASAATIAATPSLT